MTKRTLAGIGAVVMITGGAAAFAQQRGRPSASPPLVAAPGEVLPLPALGESPLESARSSRPAFIEQPSAGGATEAGQAVPPTLDVPATPMDGRTVDPSIPADTWDSAEFIDDGTSKAEQAIGALSTERDELRARLERVEAELARWEAIRDALAGAKDVDGTPEPNPFQPDDEEPAAEPSDPFGLEKP